MPNQPFGSVGESSGKVTNRMGRPRPSEDDVDLGAGLGTVRARPARAAVGLPSCRGGSGQRVWLRVHDPDGNNVEAACFR